MVPSHSLVLKWRAVPSKPEHALRHWSRDTPGARDVNATPQLVNTLHLSQKRINFLSYSFHWLPRGPRWLRGDSPLASRQGEPGSIPSRATGLSYVGIVPDDAVSRRVFSGISRFYRSFIPALLHSHSITLIGSQVLAVKNRPNLFTHALTDSHTDNVTFETTLDTNNTASSEYANMHDFSEIKGLAYPEVSSTFEVQKRGNDKGDTATRFKCAIAYKREALIWRAVFYRLFTVKDRPPPAFMRCQLAKTTAFRNAITCKLPSQRRIAFIARHLLFLLHPSGEIWPALNIEVLRADEGVGELSILQHDSQMRKIRERPCQEWMPRREACSLTTTPPRPLRLRHHRIRMRTEVKSRQTACRAPAENVLLKNRPTFLTEVCLRTASTKRYGHPIKTAGRPDSALKYILASKSFREISLPLRINASGPPGKTQGNPSLLPLRGSGGVVVRLLASNPPPPPLGSVPGRTHSRIFASGNHAELASLSLALKTSMLRAAQSSELNSRGHVPTRAVNLLASHQGDPGSIPSWVTPDSRMWESCQTMPLVNGFSPAPSFRRCSIITSITLIGSQDLTVKSR
ncbi:hypothetical protein PR048_003807 [Dryococelus australis]|uniref:Uncharacterized protein n=1 Tax=Dryococelus australis TaxID=614101 RepID=A0ABQ9IPL5_9NEOP|nr:hypothetical protein PR048_003807 [Dryococelus australis]